MNGRSGIFDVPPEFLESVAAVTSRKYVDASVVLDILDAGKDGPRLVDAL